jgi:hypothetical protein
MRPLALCTQEVTGSNPVGSLTDAGWLGEKRETIDFALRELDRLTCTPLRLRANGKLARRRDSTSATFTGAR